MKKTIFFLSSVDFEFIYQRPQALAEKLAQWSDHNIYYVNPIKKRKSSLNNSRLWFCFDHQITPSSTSNLNIINISRYLSFAGIPLRLSKKMMNKLAMMWLTSFIKKFSKGTEPVAIVETPLWFEHLKPSLFDKIYYDCIDDHEVLSEGHDYRLFNNCFAKLIRNVSKVFITADKLREQFVNINFNQDNIYKVPNAVKLENFQHPIPLTDMDAIKARYSKIIGYVGIIYHWINTELIVEISKAFPDLAIVIVGPAHDEYSSCLKGIDNIFLLGRQDYHKIASYINYFDICINPFRTGNIGNNTNPIKMYEYLAMGKPVVSTNIYEMLYFKDYVYLANSNQDFIKMINDGFMENRLEKSEQCIKFAEQNSWDARAKFILEIIQK